MRYLITTILPLLTLPFRASYAEYTRPDLTKADNEKILNNNFTFYWQDTDRKMKLYTTKNGYSHYISFDGDGKSNIDANTELSGIHISGQDLGKIIKNGGFFIKPKAKV